MKNPKQLLIVLGLALAGCAEQDATLDVTKTEAPEMSRAPNDSSATTRLARQVFAKSAAPAAAMAGQAQAVADTYASTDRTAVTDGAVTTLITLQPGAPANPAITRKIIYDAQIDLLVDSVEPIARKMPALVQDARGYIAEQNIAGSPGSQRSMHWRLRVPVDRFDSFVESIVALGELVSHNRTSQDVTEQYYDVEARIKNKKVEEQTLNKILQERSGKLEDVLKIEIELSRVRGEIEQLEGKLRVLENLSSLATLTLNIRERDKYAPTPPIVASFPTQIGRTWDSSIVGLLNHGKAIVLWAVSWAVWAPFWLAGGVLAWILLRRLGRSIARNLPRWIALARTPLTRPRTPPATNQS
jgi:Domain of unknown function (DUF4349)